MLTLAFAIVQAWFSNIHSACQMQEEAEVKFLYCHQTVERGTHRTLGWPAGIWPRVLPPFQIARTTHADRLGLSNCCNWFTLNKQSFFGACTSMQFLLALDWCCKALCSHTKFSFPLLHLIFKFTLIRWALNTKMYNWIKKILTITLAYTAALVTKTAATKRFLFKMFHYQLQRTVLCSRNNCTGINKKVWEIGQDLFKMALQLKGILKLYFKFNSNFWVLTLCINWFKDIKNKQRCWVDIKKWNKGKHGNKQTCFL